MPLYNNKEAKNIQQVQRVINWLNFSQKEIYVKNKSIEAGKIFEKRQKHND